jgi:hypothetical protein
VNNQFFGQIIGLIPAKTKMHNCILKLFAPPKSILCREKWKKQMKQVSLRNHVPVTTIGLQIYTFSQASSLMAKDILLYHMLGKPQYSF